MSAVLTYVVLCDVLLSRSTAEFILRSDYYRRATFTYIISNSSRGPGSTAERVHRVYLHPSIFTVFTNECIAPVLIDNRLNRPLKWSIHWEKWQKLWKIASAHEKKSTFRGRGCITSNIEDVLHPSCETPGVAPTADLSRRKARV